jgi:recombination protein RecA
MLSWKVQNKVLEDNMANTQDIMKKMKKTYGGGIVRAGSESYEDVIRIPTGIFAFDLISGGGFPMGRASILYGVESSGKTNIVLKLIAQAGKLYPEKKAVFLDVEHAYDPVWATTLGVDQEKIIVVSPEYAEQAADIVEAFLYAEDVSVIALDSLAALTTQNEIESSTEKAAVGGASLLVGKMFRKVTTSFTRMRNQGQMPPAFIAINQIRHKIGVMYGDPETLPGGNAPKFASSFTVRIYGKNELDKKVNPVIPTYKKTSVILKKWKFPILATTAEFQMQMIPAYGRPAGYVDDWNTLSTYLKELDYLCKDGAKWVLFGEPYGTLEEVKNYLYGNDVLLREAKGQIIKELLQKGALKEPSQESDEEAF